MDIEWKRRLLNASYSSIYTVARDITQKKNLTLFREPAVR